MGTLTEQNQNGHELLFDREIRVVGNLRELESHQCGDGTGLSLLILEKFADLDKGDEQSLPAVTLFSVFSSLMDVFILNKSDVYEEVT